MQQMTHWCDYISCVTWCGWQAGLRRFSLGFFVLFTQWLGSQGKKVSRGGAEEDAFRAKAKRDDEVAGMLLSLGLHCITNNEHP